MVEIIEISTINKFHNAPYLIDLISLSFSPT